MKEITTFIAGFFFFEAWGYNLAQAGCSLWQSVTIISVINYFFIVFEVFIIKKIIDFLLNLFADSKSQVIIKTSHFLIKYKKRGNSGSKQTVNKIYKNAKYPFLRYIILLVLSIVPAMQKFAVGLGVAFPVKNWIKWVAFCGAIRVFLILNYGPDFLYQLWSLFF